MAPIAAVHRGAWVPDGRRIGIAVKSGTKTTTRPVMKADFAAVVRGETAGLKLIAGGKEDADNDSRSNGATREVAELAVIDDCQDDEGNGHAEQIEEEWRRVFERILDKNEGRAPDQDSCEQEEMCDGGRFKARHVLVQTRVHRRRTEALRARTRTVDFYRAVAAARELADA